MSTKNTSNGETRPRDPDCFEEWLGERLRERPDRRDEVGRVARWVLRENREGRWAPGTVLLARYGHAYDVPAHYGRVLRHAANQPEESVETFFRVHDLYLEDEGSAYDRLVEGCGRRLDACFGRGNNGGSGREDAAPGEADPEGGAGERYSWESWSRFYDGLHGPEQNGYELDEDDYPVDGEADDG